MRRDDVMTWLLCKVLGWHGPLPGSVRVDDYSVQATCRRCYLPIMQDSNGSWF